MNEKTEKWWDLPQAETGLHWDRASASPPWHRYREKRNLGFSATATRNYAAVQCTCHVQSINKNKNQYTVSSQKNIYQHISTGVQTCSDVSFPTNIPQRRVLHFCHILLQYSFTTIHISLHLVLQLFKVMRVPLHQNYAHKTEWMQCYLKPSPNKVGDTKSNSTTCCEGLTVKLRTEMYLHKTCLDKGWVLLM